MLFATVDVKGYDSPMVLRNITFYGFQNKPSSVILNKDVQIFNYDAELKVGLDMWDIEKMLTLFCLVDCFILINWASPFSI